MRIPLGWLAFLLTVAFVFGLIGTLIRNSWYDFPFGPAVLGFFGFGIPTIVGGMVTAALWEGDKSLEKLLGWTGTIVGFVCGVAVLLLVAGLVLSERHGSVGRAVGGFLGFGVTGLICVVSGIGWLRGAEGKST